ncbi:hypothetical protein HYPDE_40993 [Hyphomicrobium denitrificans 1NES1]|uniref:Uncharacterized protein n=1 Tax=Hyphomicrobium denitrificans 1NES1 TaxID=670307 RepID=N0BC95_9HYPH|nr:hypothetical protein HYPDE_40993 [Hyphomicrobium denitrificans 1NES1]
MPRRPHNTRAPPAITSSSPAMLRSTDPSPRCSKTSHALSQRYTTMLSEAVQTTPAPNRGKRALGKVRRDGVPPSVYEQFATLLHGL